MAVCHIGHAELRVTNLEQSTDFFRLLGLEVAERGDDRVYLRAWQDWDHHTLVLTAGPTSGLDHCGWRVGSDADLDGFADDLAARGIEHSWTEPGEEIGQGRGLRFASPSGVPLELYAEMARYEAPEELQSPLPSHPQLAPGGAAPRRFDHINFFIDDVAAEQEWFTDTLGIHHRYYMEKDDGTRLGSWMSRTCLTHEIAFARNGGQTGAMLNHVAYYMDSSEQLTSIASFLAERGCELEWGPGRHATSGATFIYVFEPSGNRVELWTGDFLIFDPDWKPLRWGPDELQLGLEMWNSTPPPSFYDRGTALLDRDGAPLAGYVAAPPA